MKIVIEGHRFDTTKAEKHWQLAFWDQHNWIRGELYKSSKGKWYMLSPSQWSNEQNWLMTSPAEILESYRDFLQEDAIEEIAKYIDDWE